jgi:hypothetical protein
VNHPAWFTTYQHPTPLTPVDALDFQHQEVLKLYSPAGGQFVGPRVDQRFQHSLHIMVAQAGAADKILTCKQNAPG